MVGLQAGCNLQGPLVGVQFKTTPSPDVTFFFERITHAASDQFLWDYHFSGDSPIVRSGAC